MVGKSGSAYKGRRYRSYVCSNVNKALAVRGYYNGHAARKLEAAVLEYLSQFSDPKRVKELLAESDSSRSRQRKKELKGLERKLASLDRDFQKNLKYLKKGLLNEEEFAKTNTPQRNDSVQTESRLAELRLELEEAEVG